MQEQFRQLIEYAIINKFSDLHLNILDNKLIIHYRKFGQLEILENNYDLALINYIKYIANLDLTCCFKPSSGQYNFVLDKIYPLRISYIKSRSEEILSIRILNNHQIFSLDSLIKNKSQLGMIKNLLKNDNGLILVAGPTGSGKTTTLYTILNYLKINTKKRIMTLEDPIEMQLNDISQIEVNDESNLNYYEGLKQLLRHDVDIIMISEIRDEKTCKLAIRSALTGHLVLSTIHSNDGFMCLNRLLEMNISKSDLKCCLKAICSQRLNVKKKEVYSEYQIVTANELLTRLDELL